MLHYIRQKPHLQEFLESAFLFSDEAAAGSTPQSMGARGLHPKTPVFSLAGAVSCEFKSP